jgi:hypothetical protein
VRDAREAPFDPLPVLLNLDTGDWMNLPTGSGIKSASASSGRITKSPLGLRPSNAVFAKNVFRALLLAL